MRGNIRYQRELQKTYMIAAGCEKELLENYSGRMALQGKLKGLAACHKHYMDGECEMWYDITSLQTMEQLFAVKEITYQELKYFIEQLILMLEETERCLMDSRQFCLEPQLLYMDMEKGEVRFLYDYTEKRESNGICELAEYLLERTCHEEEQAVRLVYYFYEQVQKENFSVYDMESYLYKSAAVGIAERNGTPRSADRAEAGARKGNTFVQDEFWETVQWDSTEEAASGRESRDRSKKKSPKADNRNCRQIDWNSKSGILLESGLVCTITVVLLVIGFFVIQRYFELTQWEKLLWIGASVLLFLTGMAMATIGLIWEWQPEQEHGQRQGLLRGRARGERQGLLRGREREQRQGLLRGREREQRQGLLRGRERGERQELWQRQEQADSMDDAWQEADFYRDRAEETQPEDNEGRTIYVGNALLNKEHCLIEKQKGGEIKHPINAYPFVIGKEKGRVNLLLRDHSISRIHARLLEEDGNIYLEDLHSTNGTYLNDFPLTPHERIKLKRGDLLQLGRVELDFR